MCPPDTVRDGEHTPLLRRKIVRAVGVQRKGDIASRRAFPRDERANGGQNRLRLGRPERARHEVVLHIHDDEQPFYRHFFSSLMRRSAM